VDVICTPVNYAIRSSLPAEVISMLTKESSRGRPRVHEFVSLHNFWLHTSMVFKFMQLCDMIN
jgi:hypothetical protein